MFIPVREDHSLASFFLNEEMNVPPFTRLCDATPSKGDHFHMVKKLNWTYWIKQCKILARKVSLAITCT